MENFTPMQIIPQNHITHWKNAEKTVKNLLYMLRDFYDWCGVDNGMYISSTNDLLCTTFVNVLTKLKDKIPPLISVKKGSNALFTSGDAGCFCADIDIHGMMNSTKKVLDFKPFTLFLT